MFNINISSTAAGINPVYYSSSEESSSSKEEDCASTQVVTIGNQTVSLSNLLTSDISTDDMIDFAINLSKQKSQAAFKDQTKISPQQADKLLVDMCAGKELETLSSLNILVVAIMQEVQALTLETRSTSEVAIVSGKNGPQQILLDPKKELKKLSASIFQIFRQFRQYAPLLNGKVTSTNRIYILSIQETYVKIAQHHELIQGSFNTRRAKAHYHKLSVYLDLLYYCSYNENFLSKFTKPLIEKINPLDRLTNFPPTSLHVHLLENSLEILSCSLNLCEEKLDEEFISPLKEAQQLIRQKSGKVFPQLVHLDESLQNFLTALQVNTAEAIAKIQKSLNSTKALQHSTQLRSFLERLNDPNQSYVTTLETMWPLLCEMESNWKVHMDQESHNDITQNLNKTCEKFEEALNSARSKLKMCNARLPNKFKALSLETICDCKKIILLYNSLIFEPMRIPAMICHEIKTYYGFFERTNALAKEFQTLLLSNDVEQPCSAFSAIDFLTHQTFLPFFSTADQNITEPDFEEIQSCFQNIALLICSGSGNSNDVALSTDKTVTCISEDELDLEEEIYRFCDLLLPKLEHTTQDSLKTALLTLKKYLSEDHEGRHMFSMLLGGYNDRLELSIADLSSVKNHFAVMHGFSRIQENSPLIALKHLFKKRLAQASDSSKPFLKLCYKHLVLATVDQKTLIKAIEKYRHIFESCATKEELLKNLHAWRKTLTKVEYGLSRAKQQLNLMAMIASNKNDHEVSQHYRSFIKWQVSFNFFCMTIDQLIINNSMLIEEPAVENNSVKKNPLKKDLSSEQSEPRVEDILEEQEKPELDSDLPKTQVKHEPSSYNLSLETLDKLKNQPLSLLCSTEGKESYIFRSLRRHELIKNSAFYQMQMEEAEKWGANTTLPEPMQTRIQNPYFLFLEATQKISLCSLRLATQAEPTKHISLTLYNDRPLIYSHDGEMLSKGLGTTGKTWFSEPNMEFLLLRQEAQLKQGYWFKQEHQLSKEIEKVRSHCGMILLETVNVNSATKSHSFEKEAKDRYRFQKGIQKHKLRKLHQAAVPLSFKHAMASESYKEKLTRITEKMTVDPQCIDMSTGIKAAIDRVLELHDSLLARNDLQDAPLFLTTCSAEIQVNILSLTQQLVLCSFKAANGQLHPLFLNADGHQNQGRPLIHSHEVDTLFSALKKHGIGIEADQDEMLKKNLSFFVGDPRYPFPNKTLLTDGLVNMFLKVQLHHKIKQNEFFDAKDKKLLASTLGQEWWRLKPMQQLQALQEKINVEVEHQRDKTALAFHLCEQFLDLAIMERLDSTA